MWSLCVISTLSFRWRRALPCRSSRRPSRLLLHFWYSCVDLLFETRSSIQQSAAPISNSKNEWSVEQARHSFRAQKEDMSEQKRTYGLPKQVQHCQLWLHLLPRLSLWLISHTQDWCKHRWSLNHALLCVGREGCFRPLVRGGEAVQFQPAWILLRNRWEFKVTLAQWLSLQSWCTKHTWRRIFSQVIIPITELFLAQMDVCPSLD